MTIAPALSGKSPHTIRLSVDGMTCGACAARVSKALEAVPGVESAQVSLMLKEASVDADRQIKYQDLAAAVQRAGYQARPIAAPVAVEPPGMPLTLVILCAVLTAPFVFQMLCMGLGFEWVLPGTVQFALSAPVLSIGLWRFSKGAWTAVRHFAGNMDLLVLLGAVSAFGLSVWLLARNAHPHGHYFEAANVIITMVLFGQWLESRARDRASAAMRGLIALMPQQAMLVRGGGAAKVAAASLKLGDVILLGAGERCPVDGTVIGGESELDQALLTGESAGVRVMPGSEIMAGALNGMGALRIKTERLAGDSRLAQMVATLSAAQLSRSHTGRLVDRISRIFVPIVLVLAGVTAIVWLAGGAAPAASLEHAIAVLVIACPCALGLAAPAAMVAGSGAAARAGIMLRDHAAIEAAEKITVVAFDKTGTLTLGAPRVVAIEPEGQTSEALLLTWAAAAQQGATHPIAKALLGAASERGLELSPTDSVTQLPGRGVKAQWRGRALCVGNLAMMLDEGGDPAWLPSERPGAVFVSVDGRYKGAITLADALRPEAKAVLSELTAAGKTIALLSGDAPEVVARVAAELGIAEAHGNMTPQDKAAYIQRRQAAGEHAAFVGDGVNDAPVLAQATLGIAMAGAADIAGNAAAVTIMRPDLRLVPAALDIATRTRAKIRQNLFWAFVYNVLALPLAAFGYLSPSIAGAAMGLSSATVVGNASRLTSWRPGAPRDFALGSIARWFLTLGVAVPFAWTALYSVMPVPGTLLMAGRMLEGNGALAQWTALQAISPNLIRAVIAAEDNSFCTHQGFAWDEIEAAMEKAQTTGGPIRGASTITQQTAKNAFLWPARSYVRKGLEAYFTVLIETLWPKRRIMEVYLNIAEWGPGIFGAEAAAQYWFKKPAADLTLREAAALAAILPNPREYRAAKPGPYVSARTAKISRIAPGMAASCALERRAR